MTPTLARRAGALTIIAATAVALAGCDGTAAKLTYNDTEKAKVTQIELTGDSGDVSVTTSAITETRITRVIRHNTDPNLSTYRLDGTVLHLSTNCGLDCSVSYQIETPPGVAVIGTLHSGDIALAGVASVNVAVSSGDVNVTDATGAVKIKSTSGDVRVARAAGAVDVDTNSGDVQAVGLTGGPVTARANAGDVQLRVDKMTSVDAEATSGDVTLTLPGGHYQVHSAADSGDVTVAPGIVADPAATNVLKLVATSGDIMVAAAAA